MSGSKVSQPRPPRRQWPSAEKRRIVELTLRAGTSVGAVARKYGVDPTSLSHWRRLYRAGELAESVASPSRTVGPAADATFVPVHIIPDARKLDAPAHRIAQSCSRGIVQVVLASGATLRVETDTLDPALVCALVAELRR